MRNGWVIGLVIVIVAAVAAAAGYFYGISVGEARANQIRQDFFRARTGQGNQAAPAYTGQPGQGFFGPGGQAGPRGTAGTIKSVDGNTMEVSTRDSVVKVTLTDQTTVQKFATGSLSDLQVGEQVMVAGETDSSGVVTARSVQLIPESQQLPGIPPGGGQQLPGTPPGGDQ